VVVPEQDAGAGDSILVRGRAAVRDLTESVARRVDSWFGNRPFEDGGRVSGSIGFKILAQQHEKPEKNVRFRARLDLPNVEEQTYLFFGQENERDLITDQPGPFTRRELLLPEDRRTDLTGFAGLGYALHDAIDFRAGVRGGFKPFAQARYKKHWLVSARNAVEFRETLFWKPDDGFGATTALNFSHGVSSTVALRWQTAGTISKETDGMAWVTSLGAFKSYGTDRLASIEAIVSGATAASDSIGEYGVRAIWQQPIYRDWTILEVSVGHFWPQGEAEDVRGQNWALGVGVDIRF
jgi:hypothetical protein